MPRKFGGHTELGSYLNESGSKQEGLRTAKARFIVGTIKYFATFTSKNNKQQLARATNPKQDGIYSFSVQLPDGRLTGFLPLMGNATKHAALTGHPSDFLGQKCYISYEGPSANRGRIIDIVDDFIDPTVVGSNNQLQVSGAAFAPPGNGLI